MGFYVGVYVHCLIINLWLALLIWCFFLSTVFTSLHCVYAPTLCFCNHSPQLGSHRPVCVQQAMSFLYLLVPFFFFFLFLSDHFSYVIILPSCFLDWYCTVVLHALSGARGREAEINKLIIKIKRNSKSLEVCQVTTLLIQVSTFMPICKYFSPLPFIFCRYVP